jgi:hypothetical protein
MHLLNHFMARANNLEGGHILFRKMPSSWAGPYNGVSCPSMWREIMTAILACFNCNNLGENS